MSITIIAVPKHQLPPTATNVDDPFVEDPTFVSIALASTDAMVEVVIEDFENGAGTS